MGRMHEPKGSEGMDADHTVYTAGYRTDYNSRDSTNTDASYT